MAAINEAPQSTARILDVQTEWALAVALQTMSVSAIEGLSVRRTQLVVDYLRLVANSHSTPVELSNTCSKVSDLWQNIDLQ
ncbi:MAG: hypothetical protein V4632_23920 [Pseudomonadota bacterium]